MAPDQAEAFLRELVAARPKQAAALAQDVVSTQQEQQQIEAQRASPAVPIGLGITQAAIGGAIGRQNPDEVSVADANLSSWQRYSQMLAGMDLAGAAGAGGFSGGIGMGRPNESYKRNKHLWQAL